LIAEELPASIPSALLSGPSFALEVAQGLPTAVVIASNDKAYATKVIDLFANAHFRPYFSDDIIGAEIGGTVKNVMAIAAGIADGLGFGANARAALITRGLNEITHLAVKLGAHAETLNGLSGLGDLLLTCTDNQSRNRRFGLALGRGLSAQQALTEIGQVVEGVHATTQVLNLAHAQQVEMPITEQVNKVLQHETTPAQAVESLFSRNLKTEHL
jgi:glycerol-3-phosphate dehydrogenase (NAD(P)+)